ncbi:Hypothetical predicted protein [Pelobates cultripes]|uniref:Uncharacterized protein n=1 Tax=Pelobates cultripes TaxID=61616 RepID=A0AAD1SFV3_PELCU|nr:Hypothetical predicted protein [Pelobates cultripes]
MGAVGYRNTFHPKSPILALRAVVPDTLLKHWHEAGITRISQLINDEGIIPFPDLQIQWQIPNCAIFSYLQLKSVLNAHTTLSQEMRGSASVTPHLLIERCWASPTKPKALTLCYKSWQELSPNKPHPHKAQWETDCGVTLTEGDWLHALNDLSKWTKCYSHIEAHKKLLYHWYMTPQRLHRIFPTTSPTCWRCNSTTGTLIHLWCSCGDVQPLWTTVRLVLDELGIPRFLLTKTTCLLLLLPALLSS